MSYNSYIHVIGPSVLLVADAYTEIIGNWTEIGGSQGNVTYQMCPQKIHGQNDVVGNIALAGRTYNTGTELIVTVPLVNSAVAKLNAMFPESVLSGGSGSVGWKPSAHNVTERCFALVPYDVYTTGVPWWDQENVLWVMNAVAYLEDLPPLELPSSGEDNQKPYNVRLDGLAASANARIGRIWEHNLKALGLQFIFDANDDQTV